MLVNELSYICEYPEMGGLSGSDFKNLSRLTLKQFSKVILVNGGGKTFHNFADFTTKLASYNVKIFPRNLGSGFTIALIDDDRL